MFSVIVLGPFPPPTDGRAAATAWLCERLMQDQLEVSFFDTQCSISRKFQRCLFAAAGITKSHPDRAIVVASGELGLIAELIFVVTARLRRVPLTMTHHSAKYIRSYSRLMALAIKAGGRTVRHAVLDEAMGTEFARLYGIPDSKVVVVDNIGLMPQRTVPLPSERTGLVHLSNMTSAKGFDAVLRVAEQSRAHTRLIGPVSPQSEDAISRARSNGAAIDVEGAIYDDRKYTYLADARCFLFLSTYEHEAQPLVIYEAASVGCVPIVWNAGWITQQMERLALHEYVFEAGNYGDVIKAVTEIEAMSPQRFQSLSTRIAKQYREAALKSRLQYQYTYRP